MSDDGAAILALQIGHEQHVAAEGANGLRGKGQRRDGYRLRLLAQQASQQGSRVIQHKCRPVREVEARQLVQYLDRQQRLFRIEMMVVDEGRHAAGVAPVAIEIRRVVAARRLIDEQGRIDGHRGSDEHRHQRQQPQMPQTGHGNQDSHMRKGDMGNQGRQRLDDGVAGHHGHTQVQTQRQQLVLRQKADDQDHARKGEESPQLQLQILPLPMMEAEPDEPHDEQGEARHLIFGKAEECAADHGIGEEKIAARQQKQAVLEALSSAVPPIAQQLPDGKAGKQDGVGIEPPQHDAQHIVGQLAQRRPASPRGRVAEGGRQIIERTVETDAGGMAVADPGETKEQQPAKEQQRQHQDTLDATRPQIGVCQKKRSQYERRRQTTPQRQRISRHDRAGQPMAPQGLSRLRRRLFKPRMDAPHQQQREQRQHRLVDIDDVDGRNRARQRDDRQQGQTGTRPTRQPRHDCQRDEPGKKSRKAQRKAVDAPEQLRHPAGQQRIEMRGKGRQRIGLAETVRVQLTRQLHVMRNFILPVDVMKTHETEQGKGDQQQQRTAETPKTAGARRGGAGHGRKIPGK